MEIALPRLREDISLFPGPEETGGAPTWTLYDPLRHRYFRIGHLAFELLARWGAGEGRELLRRTREETFHQPTETDLNALSDFLRRNSLVEAGGPGAAAAFAAMREAGRESWWSWLLHRYLFFRIPILRPQKLLNALAPWAAPLHSRAALWLFLAITLAGLYLAGRQWDAFLGTFTAFGTWQGQVALILGMGVSKLLHEFGHALTLHRYGGRVPTMGVAFLVTFPVLYTDTGDSWRLRSRRQRLAVGSAGMVAELGLASLALLLWSFAPEGGLKAALFILATTVWIATLSINASPFMRFDGYYLLSDHLDVPNLQDRAFALGRWRLREFLFGLGEAPPEDLPAGRRRTLLFYAYGTWIYRLVLFLGIALLVYHFFFKLLGILLFAVEIWYFVTRPMALELREWWNRRSGLRWNIPTLRTFALLALLAGVVLVPWRTSLLAPAVLDAAGRQEIFPPVPARIDEILVLPGGSIAKGQVLYRLASPALGFQHLLAEGERTVARIQEGQTAVSRERAAEAALARQEAIRQEAKIKGIVEKTALLELVAPFDGRLVDVPDFVRAGQWVNETIGLGLAIAGRGATLAAYVPQEDLEAVRPGAVITFFPDDPLGKPLVARVGEVAPTASEAVGDPLLASVHGGPVDVLRGSDGVLRPVAAVYRVDAVIDAASIERRIRGVARIEGPPRNLVSRLLRSAAMVLTRESGF